jgi:hypothetical protein
MRRSYAEFSCNPDNKRRMTPVSGQEPRVKDKVCGLANCDLLEISVGRIEQVVGFIGDNDAWHGQDRGVR